MSEQLDGATLQPGEGWMLLGYATLFIGTPALMVAAMELVNEFGPSDPDQYFLTVMAAYTAAFIYGGMTAVGFVERGRRKQWSVKK